MSRDEVRNQWRTRIEEFRASGQTATAWCATHNLNLHQFRRWLHKFSEQGAKESTSPTVRWLSLQMDGSANPVASESTIVIRLGSVYIEVQDGFNPSLLKQVVHALTE